MEIYFDGTRISLDKEFVFNGGEVQVRLQEVVQPAGFVTIKVQLDSSDEVMKLLMVTDAIRREYGNVPITLEMLYVPYARQDRVCHPGEALSARVFCDLINSQGYHEVIVLMPHSDVTSALLDRAYDIKDIFNNNVMWNLRNEYDDDYILCAPDAGAVKRVMEFAKFADKHMFTCEKVRNVDTGEITNMTVNADYENIKGQTVVIYDDLADGMGTFIGLAKTLKEAYDVSKVVLVVAHGIFSKGFDICEGYIDEIITSNSFDFGNRDQCNFLTVINL